jgi:hypothetical protein
MISEVFESLILFLVVLLTMQCTLWVILSLTASCDFIRVWCEKCRKDAYHSSDL